MNQLKHLARRYSCAMVVYFLWTMWDNSVQQLYPWGPVTVQAVYTST